MAPDFRKMLSELPISTLDEMQSSISEGVSKKSHVTAADKAILQSFNDERARRKEVCV